MRPWLKDICITKSHFPLNLPYTKDFSSLNSLFYQSIGWKQNCILEKKLSLYFKRMRRRNIKNRVSGWMALGTLNNLITYKNAFRQLYSWSLRSPFFFDTASLFLFIKTPFFPKLSSSGILCKIFNDSATHFRSQNEICAVFF